MPEGRDTVDGRPTTEPSRAVIEAIAEREGIPVERVGPPEYQPLNEVVDPEALDELFEPTYDGRPRANGSITFTYCGHPVVVESDGSVRVE